MKRLINRYPSKGAELALGMLPFIILLLVYALVSDMRLAANPNDKLFPALPTMAEAIWQMAFTEDKRSGLYLLWTDTGASLKRLGLGMGLSTLLGLMLGMSAGAIPWLRALTSPMVTAIALIPPMAILPILFIVFGLEELSKVALITIGIAPLLIRDTQQRVLELPQEQLIKAQTLGGNTWQIIIRVILPQVLPRLLDAVRLSLGAAWLFLIAAEAIAATEGLGYRIFLVRRYLAMDIILPYVVWITLLAFLTDYSLRVLSRWLFPWYHRS
jgi:NitT/TauT family transport system permease protein